MSFVNSFFFFFSSRRRHTRSKRDWSSDVCSSDLSPGAIIEPGEAIRGDQGADHHDGQETAGVEAHANRGTCCLHRKTRGNGNGVSGGGWIGHSFGCTFGGPSAGTFSGTSAGSSVGASVGASTDTLPDAAALAGPSLPTRSTAVTV